MSSVLDFLSPSLAREENGIRPLARSAAEQLYTAADATFDERDGWRVPVAVPGETEALRSVGIADVSHLGKLDVRSAPGAHAQPTLQHSVTRSLIYRLSPHRALVFFPESGRTATTDALGDAGLLLDVTAAYTVLALTGRQARTLIGRLTHLHRFPSGGEVAHVTAHVLPVGEGFRIVVAQELGHYMAEVALDCAGALGGGLVGVDALPEDERP